MAEALKCHPQSPTAQGVNCADRSDLRRYLHRVATDAESLRRGLADAVTQVFAGVLLQDGLGGDLPYLPDRVERLLFDDLMGANVLVKDQNLAAALRQTMRLLEDAAQTTHIVRALLEQTPVASTDSAGTNQTRHMPA
ncbi:hypothetical protein [Streptomyces sp. NPDC023327]|uniref:hypothetical protein n=1 Tax=Streptomyces sp. NPDC023327 TaxID=3157088 RepID=UPI0033EDEA03